MNTLLFFIIFILNILFINSTLYADQYHYDTQNIGERAFGLGGAYTALSDDPSGILHNPAGIIYNYENYFSLTGYVYNLSTITFKQALGTKDYSISTNNPMTNFFGFTQNFRKIKWGFAIVFPENLTSDQNDNLDNLFPPPTSSGTESAKYLNRRLLDQYTEGLIGLAAATEVFKDFTMGLSLFSGWITHKTINTQFVEFNRNTSGKKRYLFVNNFFDQKSYFLYPKLGFQYMPFPSWSFGFVAAKKITTYSNREKLIIKTATDTNGLPVPPTNDADLDTQMLASASRPNVLSPLELSTGVAYFPDKSTLYSFDVKYYSEDPEYDIANQNLLNISMGFEYYLTEQWAVRTGLFTNNSNTPVLSNNKINQSEHVDFTGAALTFSYLTPGSSISFGAQYSTGKGKGQVVGDTTLQQNVEATNTTLLMNASMQL